jgi:hypothetical protein
MGLAMKMGAQLIAVGDLQVGVWLHTRSDPAADEWSASCQRVRDFAKRNGGDFANFRAFMVTDGGAPDAVQRKELFRDALGGYPAKTVVIAEGVETSAIKRGIATAVSWINPNFRVFEPADLAAALEHIDLEAHRFDTIWACLNAMQHSLEPNATLRRMAARNRLAPSVPAPRSLSDPPRSSGVLKAHRRLPAEPGERESVGGQRVEETDSSRARKG